MGEQLGYSVWLECSGRTIRKAMGAMEYHKCIACRRGWVNEKTRKNRLEYATVMLQRYPSPQDWYGLVTKFTLDMVHKTSYTLFASQMRDTVTPASKKTASRPRNIESAIIVGRPLVMILNQTSNSAR